MESGQTNSTLSMVHLWQMCVRSQGNELDTVLRWETLTKVMNGLPMVRCEALRNSNTDEVLQRYFRPSGSTGTPEYVNFIVFWRGMETILQTAGVFNPGGLDVVTTQTVTSLRQFRDAVLQEMPQRVAGRLDAVFPVRQLRILYERLHRLADTQGFQASVAEYWAEKVQELPPDGEIVTSDEIAVALLQWLEALLGCGDDLSDVTGTEDEPEQESFSDDQADDAAIAGPPGLEWLLAAPRSRECEPETPGAVRFRTLLCGTLGQSQSSEELSLPRFYRLVREAMEIAEGHPVTPRCGEGQICNKSTRQLAVLAGAKRLSVIVQRQVRTAFRMLESTGRPAAIFLERRSGPTSIIAGLIRSQAMAAQILDKRASMAPRAFRMACLLAKLQERARRCWLRKALVTWQDHEGLAVGMKSRNSIEADRLGPPPRRMPSPPELQSPGLARRWSQPASAGPERPAPAVLERYR
eukprot:TRINITY_DN92885_c0_g1_i1.p1 TRINITY_DN92885_c0_g1~~TRINITY_DN92885_c0_g1_i1.p1  ORF type:complete len:467 (+),score=64.38 TRINITY_DN92885_c0_g1_i1:80-1480(+)